MTENNRKQNLSIMTIIGIFFGLFGLSLLAALFYTNTERGIIVNLVCSIFFILLGVVMILFSKKSKRV